METTSDDGFSVVVSWVVDGPELATTGVSLNLNDARVWELLTELYLSTYGSTVRKQ